MVFLKCCCVIITLFRSSYGSVHHDEVYCDTESPSIIGGHIVSIEDAPFIVALYFTEFNYGKYTNLQYKAFGCGGTIIHERFILTAAHCFYWYPNSRKYRNIKYRVLAGSDQLYTGGVFIDVKDVLCHENFTIIGGYNDICVLKLANPVPFGRNITKLALPDENFELEKGVMVNVTGWGIHDFSGRRRRKRDQDNNNGATASLRQVTIPIVSQDCCSKYYKYLKFTQLCAGSQGHDICKGDRGSPLTYNTILVGVMSYARHCAVSPPVYTRVASYLGWIIDIINNHS